MKKYKDKCDSCGQFDYLKGVDGRCLCKSCIAKTSKLKNKKQMTIFDFPEVIR